MIILDNKEVKQILQELYENEEAKELIKACEDPNKLWALLTPKEQDEMLKLFFRKVAQELPMTIFRAIIRNV